MYLNKKAIFIHKIDWIIQDIPIQIRVTTRKPNRILSSPPSYLGIVVPVAESYQPRVAVVQAAGEAEGYREGRVGVLQDVPERVVAYSFYHIAGTVCNQS